MSKQYKLLPEQVENLNNQIVMSRMRLSELTSEKVQQANEKASEMFDSTSSASLDMSLLGSLHVTSESIKVALEQLRDYEILEPNMSDEIGLGSTFEIARIDDDGVENKKTLTLVQVHNTLDSFDYVSIDSPLGKAVVGARVGQEINYKVQKRLIKGSITKIIKPKVKTL